MQITRIMLLSDFATGRMNNKRLSLCCKFCFLNSPKLYNEREF